MESKLFMRALFTTGYIGAIPNPSQGSGPCLRSVFLRIFLRASTNTNVMVPHFYSSHRTSYTPSIFNMTLGIIWAHILCGFWSLPAAAFETAAAATGGCLARDAFCILPLRTPRVIRLLVYGLEFNLEPIRGQTRGESWHGVHVPPFSSTRL